MKWGRRWVVDDDDFFPDSEKSAEEKGKGINREEDFEQKNGNINDD